MPAMAASSQADRTQIKPPSQMYSAAAPHKIRASASLASLPALHMLVAFLSWQGHIPTFASGNNRSPTSYQVHDPISRRGLFHSTARNWTLDCLLGEFHGLAAGLVARLLVAPSPPRYSKYFDKKNLLGGLHRWLTWPSSRHFIRAHLARLEDTHRRKPRVALLEEIARRVKLFGSRLFASRLGLFAPSDVAVAGMFLRKVSYLCSLAPLSWHGTPRQIRLCILRLTRTRSYGAVSHRHAAPTFAGLIIRLPLSVARPAGVPPH